MKPGTKEMIEKWAEETLSKTTPEEDQEFIDAYLELFMLGSLLYKVDEHGNKTRIKRLNKDSKFDVKPASIVDGKINMEE